jgi:hypothetical protein
MVLRRLTVTSILMTLLSGVSSATEYHQYDKPEDVLENPPQDILAPDSVETRLGTLSFENGMPSEETVRLVYDNLDFQRGVSAFLNGVPVASLAAMKAGLKSVGVNNNTVALSMERLDSNSLFLTANTESIYAFSWLDVENSPLVIETPPDILGFINDAAFRYVGDVGNAGPDRGKGGKYLVVGPGWHGDYDESEYSAVYHSNSYGAWFVQRGFPGTDNGATAVRNFKQELKIYPLGTTPQNVQLLNISGVKFNTIHSSNFEIYREINSVVQSEHEGFLDQETLGILNAIGIAKGKKFAPDDRMRKILSEAAAVGNATARAQLFHTRNKKQFIYPEKQWFNGFGGTGYDMLLDTGGSALDTRTAFHFAYTGITPAMDLKLVGAGAQYGIVVKDADGNSFKGSNNYRLRVPPKVPVKNFWSVVVYDVQHRSMLITDQKFPSITSNAESIRMNDDGSMDIYFAPEAPEGMENNWIKTDPNGNWFTVFRLFGPQQAWFDQTWQLNDIERVK